MQNKKSTDPRSPRGGAAARAFFYTSYRRDPCQRAGFTTRCTHQRVTVAHKRVRFWSVQSVLEFNAIKKNLRIMSDIERVFWTVLFRMASRVFLFFTPSDSSLVRNLFVCNEPRTPAALSPLLVVTGHRLCIQSAVFRSFHRCPPGRHFGRQCHRRGQVFLTLQRCQGTR